MMFPHQNIINTPGPLLMGRYTTNHTDQILIDRRWHSSKLNVQFFRGPECDTNHYLVAAKVWRTLAVRKKAAQKFDVERFNLRKQRELEFRKQYQIHISNRFAALDNFNDSEDINTNWDNIKENIKSSA
jgi:hypothetical protein